jgi:hypothetical protein
MCNFEKYESFTGKKRIVALTIVSCLRNAALKLIYVHLPDQKFFPGYIPGPP